MMIDKEKKLKRFKKLGSTCMFVFIMFVFIMFDNSFTDSWLIWACKFLDTLKLGEL